MEEDPSGLWNRLPEPVREQIDTALRSRRTIEAIMLLRGHGPPDASIGLSEAQDLVDQRSRRLAERGEIEPEPAIELGDLDARIASIPERVAAIEAVWGGDTQGWLVRLVAVVERPSRHHPHYDEVELALLRAGGDIRLFNGTVPPWPEAAQATDLGRAVARTLGVSLYFADPQTPDDGLPRWWDSPERTNHGEPASDRPSP